MYELIDEASKVLRTPPLEFDFENPPEDPKEIEKNMAEAMEPVSYTHLTLPTTPYV